MPGIVELYIAGNGATDYFANCIVLEERNSFHAHRWRFLAGAHAITLVGDDVLYRRKHSQYAALGYPNLLEEQCAPRAGGYQCQYRHVHKVNSSGQQ